MALRAYPVGSSSAATTLPGVNDYDLLRIETNLLTEGVVQGVGTAFAVTQKAAGANMSVDVAAGIALIEITNTNLTHGATYKTWFESTAVSNEIVTAADDTNPRVDRVVLRIDVSVDPNGTASNIAIIEVLAGTPDPAPSAPATPANAISLATIAVPASDTSITDGQITDDRSYIQVGASVLQDLARESKITALHNAAPLSAAGAGSGNAYTLTVTTNATAYATGQVFFFTANHDNTDAATLNVNSWGAKGIKKDNGATAVVANDIKSGQTYCVQYAGTYFNILNPTPPTMTVTVETVKTEYTPSTELTNPTTLTSFDTGTYTIAANDIVAGVVYEFECGGTCTINASSTMHIEGVLGSTPVADITLPAGTTGTSWHFHGFLMGTAAAGASVAVAYAASLITDVAGRTVAGTGTANVATNAEKVFSIGALFGTSDAGHKAKLNYLTLTRKSTTGWTP